MAQYDEIPKTSQITPFQFQDIYLREAHSGVTDLVLVLINSKGLVRPTANQISLMKSALFIKD